MRDPQRFDPNPLSLCALCPLPPPPVTIPHRHHPSPAPAPAASTAHPAARSLHARMLAPPSALCSLRHTTVCSLRPALRPLPPPPPSFPLASATHAALTRSNPILDSSWTHLGLILDSSWTHLGLILDSSWTHFGLILDAVGHSRPSAQAVGSSAARSPLPCSSAQCSVRRHTALSQPRRLPPYFIRAPIDRVYCWCAWRLSHAAQESSTSLPHTPHYTQCSVARLPPSARSREGSQRRRHPLTRWSARPPCWRRRLRRHSQRRY